MNTFRNVVRRMVRHLGLTISIMVVITAAVRGNAPFSETAAVLIAVLVCVPMVFIYVGVTYSENKPNPLLARLVKNDVLIGLGLLVLYIAAMSGLLQDMN